METWLNRPRATAADRKFPATPFFISLDHSQSKLCTATQSQSFPAQVKFKSGFFWGIVCPTSQFRRPVPTFLLGLQVCLVKGSAQHFQCPGRSSILPLVRHSYIDQPSVHYVARELQDRPVEGCKVLGNLAVQKFWKSKFGFIHAILYQNKHITVSFGTSSLWPVHSSVQKGPL